MNSAMVNRDRAPAGDLESAGSASRGLGSVWAQSGRNEGQAHKCEHGGDIPVYLWSTLMLLRSGCLFVYFYRAKSGSVCLLCHPKCSILGPARHTAPLGSVQRPSAAGRSSPGRVDKADLGDSPPGCTVSKECVSKGLSSGTLALRLSSINAAPKCASCGVTLSPWRLQKRLLSPALISDSLGS